MDTIAVVGNARSLLETEYGAAIDAHNTVVRFNDGVPIKPEAQGTKTNLVVTYHIDKWNKIADLWGDVDKMIIDPHGLKRDLGFHPSTLLAYLVLMNGIPNITIYGVDHNVSGTFYHDHNGYPHKWHVEKEYLKNLIEKNQWKRLQ